MSKSKQGADREWKAKVLALLGQNHVMSVATVRPDGWPQVTMVGFVNDGLVLYFAVARNSQKLANIKRDPRISIAIGGDSLTRIRGLSMAARATAVSDAEEAKRLDILIGERYPERWVFAPRDDTPVILRATPQIISLIDLDKDSGHPELLEVITETAVRAASGPTRH
ncbi:MAG: pyridoxamine 5'-phosphate oxidase family protein [Caulobacteraceae bacterium]